MKPSLDYPGLALYLDETLLVVNKPAGLPTLVDGYRPDAPYLVDVLRQKYGRIWVVHRLDRDTSGVMVFARSAQAHRALNTQFEQRQASKTYHGLVSGWPEWDEKTIDLPLRPDGDRRHRTIIDLQQGKPAVTQVRVLERLERFTLVEAIPLTGRTHQIRAHLSAVGFPLVSDGLYGRSARSQTESGTELAPIGRLGLHAYALALFHPLNGQALHFQAPYPADFAQAVERLRQSMR